MPENNENVKPKGLYIPEPVVVALFHMGYADIGRVVHFMIEHSHRLPICQLNLEEMSAVASTVKDVWTAMHSRRTPDGRE